MTAVTFLDRPTFMVSLDLPNIRDIVQRHEQSACLLSVLQTWHSRFTKARIFALVLFMARSLAVTLFDLPPELHLQIFTYLDYPTCLALSQTNVYFRSMIAVEKPTTSESKLSFLCAAENWAR